MQILLILSLNIFIPEISSVKQDLKQIFILHNVTESSTWLAFLIISVVIRLNMEDFGALTRSGELIVYRCRAASVIH